MFHPFNHGYLAVTSNQDNSNFSAATLHFTYKLFIAVYKDKSKDFVIISENQSSVTSMLRDRAL